MLEHHKCMNVPTYSFGSVYIVTTKNSLLNNKNINAVENKKTAGPVDFEIDP